MRRTALTPAFLVTLGLIALPACSDRPADQASDETATVAAAPAPSLATATALGVFNAHEPTPGLLTAGQLTEAQLGALADAGYTSFISLRSPEEEGAGWEEAAAAAHGITFTRLPVAGAGDLTREKVEELDRILDAMANQHTVLYCGSANRVGAMLALRAHWLDGATPEEALALGRAGGVRGLEPAVMQLLGM